MDERKSQKNANVIRPFRELAKAALPGIASGFINQPLPGPAPAGKPKEMPLLDQVRAVIRFKHYSIRTEQSYLDWIRRFILFHGKQHPKMLGAAEVRAFLTHLGRGGQGRRLHPEPSP